MNSVANLPACLSPPFAERLILRPDLPGHSPHCTTQQRPRHRQPLPLPDRPEVHGAGLKCQVPRWAGNPIGGEAVLQRGEPARSRQSKRRGDSPPCQGPSRGRVAQSVPGLAASKEQEGPHGAHRAARPDYIGAFGDLESAKIVAYVRQWDEQANDEGKAEGFAQGRGSGERNNPNGEPWALAGPGCPRLAPRRYTQIPPACPADRSAFCYRGSPPSTECRRLARRIVPFFAIRGSPPSTES